jgi:hypothetical protein
MLVLLWLWANEPTSVQSYKLIAATHRRAIDRSKLTAAPVLVSIMQTKKEVSQLLCNDII